MIQFIVDLVLALICVFVLLPVVVVLAFPAVAVLACFGSGTYGSRFKREYRTVIKWWKENGILYVPPW